MMDNVTEEMREKWKDKVETITKSIEYGQLELNEWETDFMNSIYGLVLDGKDLSFKQSSCLTRIYNKIG
jgi:hypothetical protein